LSPPSRDVSIDLASPEVSIEPLVSERATRLLQSLQQFHPRDTDERVSIIRQLDDAYLDSIHLSNFERASVISLLNAILLGEARERSSAISFRGACWATVPALLLGVFAFLALDAYAGPIPRDSGRLLVAILLMTMFSGLILLVLWPFATSAAEMHSHKGNNQVREAAAAALGRFSSLSSLMALATACRDRHRGVRKAAASALAALLPCLLERTTIPLTSADSDAIARALPELDIPSASTALSVLESIGSTSALVPLRDLALWIDKDVLHDRILHTIARLEERQKQERMRDTLLRPSAGDPGQALLHIVEKPLETDASLLLRPPASEPVSGLPRAVETSTTEDTTMLLQSSPDSK
jgi:hypothetical protein